MGGLSCDICGKIKPKEKFKKLKVADLPEGNAIVPGYLYVCQDCWRKFRLRLKRYREI